MAKQSILRLGNPKLHEVSVPVKEDEIHELEPVVKHLRDTLHTYRKEVGEARGISAPQIGVMKRIIYIELDEPKVLYNPVLYKKSHQKMLIWDDCMCFPDLLVRVKRHTSCTISYRDEQWKKRREKLEGELSELLQHECDHLFGILATSRAADNRSFACKSERHLLNGRFANG
ncbi:MAG: peptide deformylase [Balneolaceae bacterium]|nr:peptide deformylase [Balneolaceae bacterium]